MREWIYNSLGVSQFLKHLYPLGYVRLVGEKIIPSKKDKRELKKGIMDLDSRYGFVYPSFEVPDDYSYDSRRFMNNCISLGGFPLRMFAHESGGIYNSSEVVPIKFGFGTKQVISLFDSNGKINMKEYFNKINNVLKFQKKSD